MLLVSRQQHLQVSACLYVTYQTATSLFMSMPSPRLCRILSVRAQPLAAQAESLNVEAVLERVLNFYTLTYRILPILHPKSEQHLSYCIGPTKLVGGGPGREKAPRVGGVHVAYWGKISSSPACCPASAIGSLTFCTLRRFVQMYST